MQTEQKHHPNVYGVHIECLCVCMSKKGKKMYTGKALMLILKIVSVAKKRVKLKKIRQ